MAAVVESDPRPWQLYQSLAPLIAFAGDRFTWRISCREDCEVVVSSRAEPADNRVLAQLISLKLRNDRYRIKDVEVKYDVIKVTVEVGKVE